MVLVMTDYATGQQFQSAELLNFNLKEASQYAAIAQEISTANKVIAFKMNRIASVLDDELKKKTYSAEALANANQMMANFFDNDKLQFYVTEAEKQEFFDKYLKHKGEIIFGRIAHIIEEREITQQNFEEITGYDLSEHKLVLIQA